MKNKIFPLSFALTASFCSTQAVCQQAPQLQLAMTYQNIRNLNEFWASEKLDGVRALWNGRKLVTRQGNQINAPLWFTAPLPNSTLDGELWIARGKFSEVSGTIRKHQPVDEEWRRVKFMVFDLPSSLEVFSSRNYQLVKLVDKLRATHIQAVKQSRISDKAHLEQALKNIVKKGGEGLMLHRGSSLYQARRTDDLQKVKLFEDAEAEVIAYKPGKGKFKGLMGSMLVKTSDGLLFSIGTGFSDEERRNPPAIGSLITYRHQGKTNKGIPRFASFMRIRDES